MPEMTLTLDSPQLVALSAFGARFHAYADLKDPLLAITEAARLKGRLEVLVQLELYTPEEGLKARQMIDLLLASILETYLDERYDTAPVRGLLTTQHDHVKGF